MWPLRKHKWEDKKWQHSDFSSSFNRFFSHLILLLYFILFSPVLLLFIWVTSINFQIIDAVFFKSQKGFFGRSASRPWGIFHKGLGISGGRAQVSGLLDWIFFFFCACVCLRGHGCLALRWTNKLMYVQGCVFRLLGALDTILMRKHVPRPRVISWTTFILTAENGFCTCLSSSSFHTTRTLAK